MLYLILDCTLDEAGKIIIKMENARNRLKIDPLELLY
jgi:hypothetical protein